MTTKVTSERIPLGLVLAGGLARRMGGGDKARIRIGGVDHPRARAGAADAAMHAASSSTPTAIRARFADTGLPVVPTALPDFAGPLAGILAGLDWAAAQRAGDRRDRQRAGRLSVPAGRPGRRGCSGAQDGSGSRSPARARANGAIRSSGCGRWRCARICGRRWWRRTCTRSRSGPLAMAWRLPIGRTEPVDPFFNVNTPEDVAEAERLAAQDPGV